MMMLVSYWVELKKKLLNEINQEFDSLRFYSLGANWERKIEHIGQKKPLNPQGILIL